MPRHLPVLVSTAFVAAIAAWKLLEWRAQKRARLIAQRVEYKEGAMVEYDDYAIRATLLATAIQRASKWCSLSLVESAKPLVGQVGGISQSKRPVLSLEPDYVMKPLLTDHRGIREIAFYEALCNTQKQGKHTNPPLVAALGSLAAFTDRMDTIAMALAMVLHDKIVLKSERALNKARHQNRREQELMRRFSKFVPNYYGVVGKDNWKEASSSFGHLLLQDVTMRFRKPCVMDLKMGRQTFEPDAPDEKRLREFQKYPLQSEFGFRIVGMRVYDPSTDGEYRRYTKAYGRELTTKDDLKEAFRKYFAAASGRCWSNFLTQLRPIQRWFEDNDCFAFYASSILLVYEGEGDDNDDVTVKLIDFGRVRRQRDGDNGYSHGLETLVAILSELSLEQQSNNSTSAN